MTLADTNSVWAVVPAAGSGSRFDSSLAKQFFPLRGSLVAEQTLSRLLLIKPIDAVIVPCDIAAEQWQQVPSAKDSRVELVAGGARRADSVINGLRALAGRARASDWVLVHDMARPCITCDDINRLLGTDSASGAILAAPIVETLKRIDDGCVQRTVPREQYRAAQTPQLFPYAMLLQAMEDMLRAGQVPTDEASAMEFCGHSVAIVDGRQDNIKITRAEDLAVAGAILDYQQQEQLK